jgi:hypothetical protein
MVGLLSEELENVKREVVLAYFRVQPRILTRGNEESQGKSSVRVDSLQDEIEIGISQKAKQER